jgi:hypothetical protein
VNHDRFHAIADTDPLWTETTWWGFAVPDHPLGGMVYTLFRPNLRVASVIVQLWDGAAVEPWRSPYARSLWHLPHPTEGDLDDLAVGPLRLRCLEPGSSYSIAYDDGDALQLDLRYDAAMALHEAMVSEQAGHLDQLCHVTGTVVVGGHELAVDSLSVRDRSWYVRQDRRSMRAGYTYGAVDAGEHFLVFSRPAGDGEEYAVHGGYLVRDGEQAAISSGTRTTVGRRRGHPDVVEVRATDALGRSLSARGQVTASLASASTPGMFAWMSIADWDVDGRAGHGEDHDVWSPDRLAALHAQGRS